MHHHDPISRRHFLGRTCRSALASVPVLSTLANLRLANYAAADSLGTGNDRKSLVSIYLPGGMDGYHLLAPRDDDRYADYAASRTNLAMPRQLSGEAPVLGARGTMINLEEAGGSTGGELYGVHPGAQEIADMFNGTGDFAGNRRLSFVSNVGSLIRPLTIDQYFAGQAGVDIPVGVAGHARQSEQWQTVIPQGTVDLNGWLGRAADLVQSAYNRDRSSMNLSLSGNNLVQVGNETRPFTYTSSVPLGLTGEGVSDLENPLAMKNLMHKRLLGRVSDNYVDKAFSEISDFSLDQQLSLKAAIDSFDESSLLVQFPTSPIGRQLKEALTLIATREVQGLCRQSFFITSGSWDDHFELTDSFDVAIRELSEAVAVFQRNLDHLGLADSVITFTTSEFARTLRSTGAGSDHAWGGPQMIFGGPIESGKVLGRYPNLTLDSDDDIGRGGRILPAHSCDEYFVEMLRWFGLDEDKVDLVLPNYKYFRDRDALGYLRV